MLRTAPMSRALILVPRSHVDTVIEAVASLGVLHLLDLSGREEWSWAVRPPDVDEAIRARREALRGIAAVVRFFAPPPAGPGDAAVLPAPDAVERQLETWSAEMEELRSQRQRLVEQSGELERVLGSVTALSPAGVDPSQLREMRLLQPACGWLAAPDLVRLEELLARIRAQVRRLSGHARSEIEVGTLRLDTKTARVTLGGAIVRNPTVFLFDEPLSNLDAKMRVQMRSEF